jgi:putative Ca2+/H+ antiporter (TMEM165/GDT1 family)
MDFLNQLLQHISATSNNLFSGTLAMWSATAGTSFALIAAAEIGDKSQLVCMTLASRHRALPVILGATFAFAFLNSLAVIFGVAIANWLPEYIVSGIVALLFAVFGIHALLINEDDDDTEKFEEKSNHSVFFTTFVLITVAEFGDKTQLAVVALSSTALPAAVWTGATLALFATSTLGVLAGRIVLKKIPLTLLHRSSAVIFLILACAAGYNTYITSPYYLL